MTRKCWTGQVDRWTCIFCKDNYVLATLAENIIEIGVWNNHIFVDVGKEISLLKK